MGIIASPILSVDNLRFTALRKGKVYKAVDVVLLDRRSGKEGPDTALLKLADGSFTVLGSRHMPNGNWAVTQYGLDKFEKSVLSALVRIGAITQKKMNEHVASAADGKARSDWHRAKDALTRNCEALGIPMPELPEAPQ